VKQHVKNYAAGGSMLLIGGGALAQSLQYGLGTPGEVGSGFFPAAVSGVLALLGLAIVLRARIQTGSADDAQVQPFRWEWRGWLCIIASIAAFMVLGQYGGLLPATFVSVFVAAMGDRKNTWRSAALLAGGITVVAAVVFSWALQVQLPLFQWGGQ
jgi:hypothetical protein